MTAHAQGGGIDSDPGDPGTGGKNPIQGTIYYPTGRRFERRVNVKLVGLGNGEMSTLTDDNGSLKGWEVATGSAKLSFYAAKKKQIREEKDKRFWYHNSSGKSSGQDVNFQIQQCL